MVKYIKKLIFNSSFALIFIFCNNNNAIAYSNIKVDQLASNSTQVCANYLNNRDAFLQDMQDSSKNNPDTQNKNLKNNMAHEKTKPKPKPIYFGTQKEVLERQKEIREYEKEQALKIKQQKLAQKQILYAAQQQQKENQIRVSQCLQD
jgi:hypothetical protein